MEVMLSSATASASASRWIPNISSIRASSTSSFRGISSNNSQPQQKIPISRFPILSSASSPNQGLAAFSVPLAASLAILLWSSAPGRVSQNWDFMCLLNRELDSVKSQHLCLNLRTVCSWSWYSVGVFRIRVLASAAVAQNRLFIAMEWYLISPPASLSYSFVPVILY